MANLTPEQFEKALSNAKQALKANMGKILINATNIGSAEMQIRVFNRGLTTAGKQMNYRSKPYMKLRQDAGLQTNWKDLTFTGDLFYSMNILSTAEKEVTYGFNNGETAQIAEWQQTSDKQVNEPIFELSQKEINRMEKQMALDAMKIIQGAINGFPNVPSVRGDAVSKSIGRKQKKEAKIRQSKQKKRLTKTVQSSSVQSIKKSESISKKQASIQKTQAQLAKSKKAESKAKIAQRLAKQKEALNKMQTQSEKIATRKSKAEIKLQEIRNRNKRRGTKKRKKK